MTLPLESLAVKRSNASALIALAVSLVVVVPCWAAARFSLPSTRDAVPPPNEYMGGDKEGLQIWKEST
uniref:Uncharacterized protein n=1 Tax=Oryza nivara TaxID=4536 RepID=A0A0E0HP15_ORYNI